MTDIEEVLSRLDPKIRKRVSYGNDITIEKQPMPVKSLTSALGGGLAYGRQTLVWGNKSAGKSSLCLQIIADAQKNGKVCAWIDAEKSYDPAWAERLGVDNDSILVFQASSVNHITDISTKLMQSGVDVIVIDSISAGLGGVFFDKKGDLKELEDTGQIGADAKAWSHAVKMMNHVNDNTLLILISQARASIAATHVEHIPTGGKSVLFYSSTVLRLTSSNSAKESIRETIDVNGSMSEEVVGRKVHWSVQYNKLSSSGKTGEYHFYFGRNPVGLDKYKDLVDECVKRGIIKKEGSWFTMFDEKMQGEAAVIERVKESSELFERLSAEIV